MPKARGHRTASRREQALADLIYRARDDPRVREAMDACARAEAVVVQARTYLGPHDRLIQWVSDHTSEYANPDGASERARPARLTLTH